MTPRNTILVGDALDRLRDLDTASVDTVITSPPFYNLRTYGVAGQIGLERDVEGWVASMRAVMAEVARVLKPAGSAWLDLADSYAHRSTRGVLRKSLFLGPERLMQALVADGWRVRNKIIWAKTRWMPECVADRLTVTYDTVYFLTRSADYYFDLDAIRERTETPDGRIRLGKNPGDVWSLPSSRSFKGVHFATFPEQLVERPLRATCPERICAVCDKPWRRGVEVSRFPEPLRGFKRDRFIRRHPVRYEVTRILGEFEPCGCNAPTRPGVVLDPFFGTGTVGVVAEREGRDWLGIELNPAYARLAWQRIQAARPRSSERDAA